MVAQLFAPRLLVVGGPMTTIWSFYDCRLSGRALKPAVIGKNKDFLHSQVVGINISLVPLHLLVPEPPDETFTVSFPLYSPTMV